MGRADGTIELFRVKVLIETLTDSHVPLLRFKANMEFDIPMFDSFAKNGSILMRHLMINETFKKKM